MRFGMCVGNDEKKIKLVAESGFDYVESCFSLLAESDEDKLNRFKSELDNFSLKCESVNCFLPGNLKVTGPDVDYDALKEYIEKGISRGVTLGLEKLFSAHRAQEMSPMVGVMKRHTDRLFFSLKKLYLP